MGDSLRKIGSRFSSVCANIVHATKVLVSYCMFWWAEFFSYNVKVSRISCTFVLYFYVVILHILLISICGVFEHKFLMSCPPLYIYFSRVLFYINIKSLINADFFVKLVNRYGLMTRSMSTEKNAHNSVIQYCCWLLPWNSPCNYKPCHLYVLETIL